MAGVNPQTPIWKPEILSLAVGQAHHNGNFEDDDMSSGLWRPSGAGEDFYVASDSGVPYVGPGLQHADWSGKCPDGFRGPADYGKALLSLVDDGSLPAGLYTAGLAIPQSAIKADPTAPNSRFQQALAFIDAVNALQKNDSRVIWSTYNQVVATWQDNFDAAPQRAGYEQIPSSRHACSPP